MSDMTVYVVEYCREILAIYASLNQAKRFCADRIGEQNITWIEHNARGHWWSPALYNNYTITDMQVKGKIR